MTWCGPRRQQEERQPGILSAGFSSVAAPRRDGPKQGKKDEYPDGLPIHGLPALPSSAIYATKRRCGKSEICSRTAANGVSGELERSIQFASNQGCCQSRGRSVIALFEVTVRALFLTQARQHWAIYTHTMLPEETVLSGLQLKSQTTAFETMPSLC